MFFNKCEVKMAGCWPSSFFACSLTEESRSINSQKKNEGNIQPSFIIWLSIRGKMFVGRGG